MSSLERVLKGYEGPDEFFLHDVNAGRTLRPGGKLDVRSLRVLRPGSVPPRGQRKRQECPGGARRSRTDDILLAKQALYQLSYGPIPEERVRARGAVGDLSADPAACLVA